MAHYHKFWSGGYLPRIPAIYAPKFPIKNQIYKLNFTINFESRIKAMCGILRQAVSIFPRVIFNHLKPTTNAKHQCLTHTSPSPLQGMWANVNLLQTPCQWIQWRKPDDTDSTTAMRIQAHQYRFDNHDTSSTTPQVGTSQRWKPDDADSTTTRIRQRWRC